MPRYGISVEKSTLFRGVQQPFSNIYFYEAPTIALTADVDQEALLDQVVAKEKEFHATVVNFVRGRVWNTGSGSQAGNQMRVDKSLSGAGALANVDFIDRERAVLIRIPAGINARGKPVYLRKWYHTCAGAPGQVGLTNAEVGNTAQLAQVKRDAWANKLNDIQELEILGTTVATLCAQTGRVTTGEPECHPWLEHHQLGDAWR